MPAIRSTAPRGLLAILLVLSIAGCGRGAEQPAAPPIMPVTVAVPLVQDVVDWDDYVGRFEAIQNVEVKPRATGYLQAVHFQDGQYVRAGQLLFTIDPRQSQAALAQSQAQLARAQATLVNARTELARSRALAAQRAASTEEVEQRQAGVRTAEADVAAARAAIRTQQLALGFTRVLAPISGRISERRVDPGNSVTADQTVLTTIVSTDPLHFAFEGSEDLLLKNQRSNGAGGAGTPVRIRLGDEAAYGHAGRLDFIDTTVSPGSGTVRARAVVPNPDGFIKPGMYGQARVVASQRYRAMLVPDTAVVTDAARRVLYVADAQGLVLARPVELGPLIGGLRVIRSGIGPRDRIVINGIQRARPGQKVKPVLGQIRPVGGPEPAPAAPSLAPSSVATPAA
jgi:RND family efflux transporter MFP subunit